MKFDKELGFTLLEMGIVLIITSIVAVGVMVTLTDSLTARQLRDTTSKLEAIQKALYDYRVAFSRLPCPADVTQAMTSATFGTEVATPGSCATANFTSAYDIEGMVPTRTLRLPDDYAIDSWGRRIMYAVTKDMTQTSAFNIIAGSDATTRMTVKNADAGANTTQAAYVLLSFGPNGHGSYSRSGGNARLNGGSTNADEWNNCDCDTNANPTGLDGIFVQKDATVNSTDRYNNFDDVVMYATRANLLLQSSLYWDVIGNGNTLICPTSSMTCVTTNGIKSCTCNQ